MCTPMCYFFVFWGVTVILFDFLKPFMPHEDITLVFLIFTLELLQVMQFD